MSFAHHGVCLPGFLLFIKHNGKCMLVTCKIVCMPSLIAHTTFFLLIFLYADIVCVIFSIFKLNFLLGQHLAWVLVSFVLAPSVIIFHLLFLFFLG